MSKYDVVFIETPKLFPSPTNPRKTYDPEKMRQLVESIREHGIIFPLLVCPREERYEIVAGERRFHGGVEVKLPAIPCFVRHMSQTELLEYQLIENLQREDLTPLEEAGGFRQMLDLVDDKGKKLYTVELIAAKIGKSQRHIWRRLKLIELPEETVAAIKTGLISVSIGELIGRVPDRRLREQVTQEVLHPKNRDGAMTYDETELLLKQRYMRTLEGCDFEPEDATLHPLGQKCSTCPQRAGNNPDIEGVRGDMCMNPVCFKMKSNTAFERWKEKHETDGKRALTPEETKKHVAGDHVVAWSSNLVALDEVPADHLLNARADRSALPIWRRLVEGRGVQVIVARREDDSALECVDREKAVEAAKLNGHNIFKLSNKEERAAFEEQQKAEREEKKNRLALFEKLLEEIPGKAGTDLEEWARHLVICSIESLATVDPILKARKLSSAKKLVDAVKSARGPVLCELAAQALFALGVDFEWRISPAGVRLLKSLKIEPAKVQRRMTAEAAEKTVIKQKAAKKAKSIQA